ncbi:hypothetical protein BCR34DRAFT_561870 [Clohesyomyces aquaticus]|uniref:Uncharacterized protein n=1 Tax=Clohesyomyces aquaticus TaxID=1231657 RepID=A0A1Y1ZTT3_9PLEO|nr:hypothetical protein BCR34DRAFT_561870 [Clohesyomyces aquaticus]
MPPSFKFSSQASSSSPLPVARPYTPPYMESPPPTPSSLEYHTDLSPWLYDSDDDNTKTWAHSAENAKTTVSKPRPNGNAHSHPSPQSDMASSPPSSPLPYMSSSEPSSPLPHLSALPPRSKQDRADTDTSRGQPMPQTPTRTLNAFQPQYPYTPQTPSNHVSANTPLRSFSPMPWSQHQPDNDTASNPPPSPVQSALLSCLTNLSDLIQDTQPSGSEMEYLINQFERISSYLTRDRDQTSTELGLGIDMTLKGEDKDEDEGDEMAYFGTVDAYVKGVKAHAADLRDRLDEVRELNRIQWDVICELRAGQKKTGLAIESAPEAALESEGEEGEEEKSGWRTLWGIPGALGGALDMFGEEIMEW